MYDEMFKSRYTEDDEEYMAVREAIASGITARRLPKDHPGRAYKKVWDSLAVFSKDSNLLVLNGRRICIPKQARPALLARMHLAHGGLVKTKELARQLYYWPTVNNDITNMVGACEQCRAHLPSLPKLPSRAFSAPICPMSHLGADLFQCGGAHFLLLVDRYSGMPFVWPLRGLSTAEVTQSVSKRSAMMERRAKNNPVELARALSGFSVGRQEPLLNTPQ